MQTKVGVADGRLPAEGCGAGPLHRLVTGVWGPGRPTAATRGVSGPSVMDRPYRGLNCRGGNQKCQDDAVSEYPWHTLCLAVIHWHSLADLSLQVVVTVSVTPQPDPSCPVVGARPGLQAVLCQAVLSCQATAGTNCVKQYLCLSV